MATQSPSQSGQGSAKKKSPPLPTQKAAVIRTARVTQSKTSTQPMVDEAILKRIKSCLDRANHPNTAEFEAQTAWRMSARLMAQYNVTQADFMAKATNDEDLAQIGGESVVAITTTKSRLVKQAWVSNIAWAMSNLFDCSKYSTARATSIEWTFYGIAANTVPAAMAFEMAHNLTLEWAREKQGAKHDYCMGIGDGLVKIVRDEKKAQEKQAKEAEKAVAGARRPPVPLQPSWATVESKSLMEGFQQRTVTGEARQSIQQRSSVFGGSTFQSVASVPGPDPSYVAGAGVVDDSDDEDSFEAETTFREADDQPIDLSGDFEDQLQAMAATARNIFAATVLEGKPTPTAVWQTSQALVHFRQSSQKVAEQYLKEQNIKIKNSRQRKPWTTKRPAAYAAGVEDSKDIDVKRRRIEGPK